MSEEKDLEIQGGIIQFSAGKPIEIVDTSIDHANVLSKPQQSLLSAVGSTVGVPEDLSTVVEGQIRRDTRICSSTSS